MQVQLLSNELQEYKMRLESQTEFKHLQEEIENLQRQNKYLTRDIQVIEDNLATERKSNEILSKELQDEKNRGMEREQELVRFRMETKEMRDLMEKLKDQVTARRNEESEFRTTLRDKNRAIDQYIKELQDLAR